MSFAYNNVISQEANNILLIQSDSGLASGTSVTFTGSTNGGFFTGSGSTVTQSFNYMKLPTTTSAGNGQITLNSSRFFYVFGTTSTYMGTGVSNFTNAQANNAAIGPNCFSGSSGATQQYVAIGHNAASSASLNGSSSVIIGYNASTANTSGNNYVAVGALAAQGLTSGLQSTAVGYNTLSGAITGSSNNALGVNALSSASATSMASNNAIGSGALSGITTGTFNVAIGYNAGSSKTTSDSHTININSTGTAGTSNSCRIGASTGTGQQQLNKTFIHGIRGITTVNNNAIAVLIDSAGQLGTVSSSIRYKENISDMNDVSSPVLNLRPVTFDFIGKPSHKKQVGLIAEEVENIMPSLVAYNQDGEVESVKYHDVSILLLNEIKRVLARIEYLESKII